jgi:valyl-tRNA synthetase
MQWWCRMGEMAAPAMQSVNDEVTTFFPPKFRNLYRHWMEHIKDWWISRQLWWGQRIPAWYDTEGGLYVAHTAAQAHEKYASQKPALAASQPVLRQDEDVLDTWFSSWLWPMEVFGWNKDATNADLAYYYPTQTLVTAPEIIFFWVARMMMAGYRFQDKTPFEKVYFTGIVRDKAGRKMSKQFGNSPDLLQLIEDFGADAVRFSVMICSPAGNDVLFDEGALEQGRNFCNKMWNAMKLVKGWEGRVSDEAGDGGAHFALDWMDARLAQVSGEVAEMMKDFRLNEALKTIYSLIWNDYCSWYLEWVKPAQDQPVSAHVWQRSVAILEQLLQLLHPFMPFITEEIYHIIAERAEGDDLIVKQLPVYAAPNTELLKMGALLQELITAIRDTRNKNQLKPKESIQLWIDTQSVAFYEQTIDILRRQVNADSIGFTTEARPGCLTLVVQTDKLYMDAPQALADTGVQKDQIQKDLDYLKGFLSSVEKKLNNEKFVNNAKPEIIAAERKKQADAQDKIKTLEESLANLG